MPRFISLVSIAILISSSVLAQKNPHINKDDILVQANNKDKAKKELSIAEKYYKKGEGTYDEALKYYLRLYKYNSQVDALNYKIAACYLLSSDKKASLPFILNSKPETAKDYYYLLGKAYQYNYKYTEAQEAFKKHYELQGKWNRKEKLRQLMQLKRECNFGQTARLDSTPVFITNLGPVINTYYDEYGGIYTPKDSCITYTSRRPKKEPSKKVSRYKFNEQILIAPNSLYENAVVSIPLNGLNKSINNAVAGFNGQQELLYFYKGKRKSGDIYSTPIHNYKAKKRKNLNATVNHLAYKETSISIADNGNTYFVSNRGGGEGGKDIWKCVKKGKNRFGKRRNIGDQINTPFNEECIFVTPDDNTLYFSSNGHGGMGGFDVFKCEKLENGTWGKPINLGYPINSPDDELFYRPTNNPDIALYSAVRTNGHGGMDIYKIVNDNRIPFSLSGIVSDIKSADTLMASLQVFDLDSTQPVTYTMTDSISKKYLANFEDVGNYIIQVDVEGYKSLSDTIVCPADRHAHMEMDFQLEKLKSPFTINGYVRDSATLAPLMATINCYDAETDTLLARQMSNEHNGKYSITLGDKYIIRIEISSEDYFAITDSINVQEIEDVIIKRKYDLVSSKTIYTLDGFVKSDDNTRVNNASIFLYKYSEPTTPTGAVKSDSTGYYSIELDEEGPFITEVKAESYFFLTDTILFSDSDSLRISHDFVLKTMKTGAVIVVQNILFNSGKSTLKPESFIELDKLANLLIENGDIKIEVSGHTDNTGSAAINKRISKARALSVKNYLVTQGVEEERLEYEGYGFEQSIAPNTTVEGRTQNRRVEIKVLE